MLHLSVRGALNCVRQARVAARRSSASTGMRALSATAGGPPDMPPPSMKAALGADDAEEVNMLEGKRTRDMLHAAMESRAADAIRYDYYAQRAEVEAEVDVAPLFRTLSETAKQQAMGYLELMEEYGDAPFGSTVRNLEIASQAEQAAADGALKEAAAVASEEGFEQIEEWYQDLMDAGYRAATKIDDVSALLEDESSVGEELGEDNLMENGRRN